MAKFIVRGVFILMSLAVFGETNINQCVGQNLNSDTVQRLPLLNNSNDDFAVLGFLRGTITGDYRGHLFPLTDEQRVVDCGTANLDSLTTVQTNEFYHFALDMGFTNHVVISCSKVETNGVRYVSLRMKSVKGPMVKYSTMDLSLITVGNESRIQTWEVDDE